MLLPSAVPHVLLLQATIHPTAPAVGVGSTAASDNVGVGSTAPDNVGVGSTAPSGTTQTDPDTAADGEQPAPAPDPDFS